jgi:diketogulonate reductase-like aldo/keto reductase
VNPNKPVRGEPEIDQRRRNLLKVAALTGATAALPGWALAQTASAGRSRTSVPAGVITRPIPGTSEQIPIIGLGTFLAFDRIPGAPRDELREVIRTYWESGARLIDTSPLYGTAETTIGDFAAQLAVSDQMFVANKLWATGEYLSDESHLKDSLRLSSERLWRRQIDLMQCHSLVNVEVVVPYMAAWKKEGLIRYAGISHYENPYHDLLAHWLERARLDFVQVNYSIANRHAEEKVFPLAARRNTAVLVNMPFEKARLFKLVEGRPVPPFAADAGITTWAAYFLKWAASHPAVTTVLCTTSNPAHARENVAALHGELPNPALRQTMLEFVEALPGYQDITTQPWYPGKSYPGVIREAQQALRARVG